MSKTPNTDRATQGMQPQRDTGRDQDFWLIYPSDTESDNLAQAVHALYYLPANYKLVASAAGVSADFIARAHDSFLDRVRFETDTQEGSPLSYVGAIIYGDANDKTTPTGQPTVVVSQGASKAIEVNGQKGFTVLAGNPEALATAVLRISRATA